MHTFLVCACKYQDFARSQKYFARSHDRETVTFRNSAVSTKVSSEQCAAISESKTARLMSVFSPLEVGSVQCEVCNG